MNIRHHPDESVLIDYANDTLDEAAQLVVATHVALCPQCRAAVRTFECIGGALLETMAIAGADTITAPSESRLGPPAAAPARRDETMPPTDSSAAIDGVPPRVARLLRNYDDSNWKWLGPGIQWKPILPPGDDGIRAFLLKARPGTQMPDHKHDGIEWTQVLTGAFAHEFGHYGPGDFDEADDSVQHRPIVQRGETCICIVAMKGQLQLQGVIGKLIQPFVRF